MCWSGKFWVNIKGQHYPGPCRPGHPISQVPGLSYREEGSALNFFLYQPVTKVCWLLELLKEGRR